MTVTLKGDEIRSMDDIHRILAKELDFGPHYGANLAALRDRLTYDVERPVCIVWQNSQSSRMSMGDAVFYQVVDLLCDVENEDIHDGMAEIFSCKFQ